ncbi:hypothetical protein [Legionella hackeliae]|uniref:Uncharacterized protein n=1 Tax=Legionella hackeliae TaxID=449 RepID=A0A0A8UVC3_LEGHA|nr:hypothetical protein [Legionella hackeliae]KTD09631.1 hypothetical protein Lhac_1999 [Legionella hackeliae]CEK11052.1 protein of unknown function [Legionella hackeliae]STX47797.1 Uncharacterised protein [Legionella hackeliae]
MNNTVVVDQNLTQLLKVDEENRRQLLSDGIKGNIPFFIMNIKSSQFQLLTVGQLQQIQSAHPEKARIYLEDFQMTIFNGKVGNTAHSQFCNFSDLWTNSSHLEEVHPLDKEVLMPGDEHYASELDIANMAQRALINQKVASKDFKKQARNYLKSNYPNLSETAIIRIIAIINPDCSKSGGRPKIN